MKANTSDIQRLRSALVSDGLGTYPMAMQAVAEFRREVFSILERVTTRRATAVYQIVGRSKFKTDSHAVDDFLHDSDTWLSIYTTSPCSFQLYVSWRDVGTQ